MNAVFLDNLLICICGFDGQNAPVGDIFHWETFILLFFILGHKEFKVEREYRVKVFNGFINAWFDYWLLQISIGYDYADTEIKEEFFWVFFCITIFPEEAQNENKVGIKTTFLLMTVSYPNFWPKMSLTRVVWLYIHTSSDPDRSLRFSENFGREVF